MSRWWLFGTVPLAALGAVALTMAVLHLVRTHRTSVIARVALAAEVAFPLDTAGDLILSIEGPRFSRSFARLRYVLLERDTEATVHLHPIWLRSSVSGLSNERLAIHSFSTEKAGTYLLRVEGLRPGIATEGHNLVVTRNTRGASILAVIVIVVSTLGLIAAAVLTVIVAVSTR